jgi:hypothetical protein
VILNPGEEPSRGKRGGRLRLNPRYHLWKELWRLQRDSVKPREALEAIIGVWLMSYYDPRTLPDDERLTYALANAVLRLAPLYSQKRWTRRGMHVTTQAPGALAVGLLGRRLRDALAPFFVNVVQALEAEYQAQVQKASDLRASFHERPASFTSPAATS